jgi:signal peptidase
VLKRLLSALVLLALMGSALAFLLPREFGGRASYVSVAGISMQPTMNTGDLVVLHRRQQYAAGDVVGFRIDDGSIVIHRIVGGSAVEGFVLQGDNRDSVDLWRPTANDILGSQWVHVPKAGRLLRWLGQPINLGIVLAGIMAFPLLGDGPVKRRRRKRGTQMTQPDAERTTGTEPIPEPQFQPLQPRSAIATSAVALAFAVAAVVAIVSTAALIFATFQPTARQRSVERLRYEHTAAFDYAVHTAPATLYPERVVRPMIADVGAPSPSAAMPRATSTPQSRPEQAIYTQLAQRIVVEFRYALETLRPTEGLNGELSAVLEVRAGANGWRRTQELIAPVAITDRATSTELAIDLAPLQEVIAATDKEAGSKSKTYELVVAPTVRISGGVGGERIDEVYTPTFTFSMDEQQIIPAPQLTHSLERVLQTQVTEPTLISLLGQSVPIEEAARVATFAVVPSLLVTAVLGAVLFLGVGRSAAAQIHARYGSMLLPIDPGRSPDARRRVRVGAFRDLVRLAKRDEPAVIFHEYVDGWHRYTVEDATTVYEFQVEETGKRDGLREFLTTGRP